MTNYVGKLVNKTTGFELYIVNGDSTDDATSGWYSVQFEGDTVYHDFKVEEYDFIPARKTFQEQFNDLKIGDVFTVDGYTGYRVKVDEKSYYSSNTYALTHAENVDSNEDITKKED